MPRGSLDLSVKALVRDPKGRILVLRRSASSRLWPGVWDLPGGKLDPGERFDTALLRETREETALHIELEGLAGASEWPIGEKRIIFLVLRAFASEEAVSLSQEHDAHRWVRPEELRNLEMVEPVVTALVSGTALNDLI